MVPWAYASPQPKRTAMRPNNNNNTTHVYNAVNIA